MTLPELLPYLPSYFHTFPPYLHFRTTETSLPSFSHGVASYEKLSTRTTFTDTPTPARPEHLQRYLSK